VLHVSAYLPRSILKLLVDKEVEAVFEAEAVDDTEHGFIRCVKYVSLKYTNDLGNVVTLPGTIHHVWVEDPDEVILNADMGDVIKGYLTVTQYIHRKTGVLDYSVQHPRAMRIIKKAHAFH